MLKQDQQNTTLYLEIRFVYSCMMFMVVTKEERKSILLKINGTHRVIPTSIEKSHNMTFDQEKTITLFSNDSW